jgi:hypothetical protein
MTNRIVDRQINEMCKFLSHASNLDLETLVELQIWFEKLGGHRAIKVDKETGEIAVAAAKVLERIILDKTANTDFRRLVGGCNLFVLDHVNRYRDRSSRRIEHEFAGDLRRISN